MKGTAAPRRSGSSRGNSKGAPPDDHAPDPATDSGRDSDTGALVNAAARVMSILEVLSGHRSSTLEEVSRGVNIAKPTVFRFLNTLQALGYVRREPDDRWALGMKLFVVGSRVLDHADLLLAARPIAEDLAGKLGETVHMGVLEGDAAVYVLKVESRHTIRMYSRVGRRIPLHCTALGKAILAHLPEAEAGAIVRRLDLVRFTPGTIATRPALFEELREIRAAGFARDSEEHEEGIRCIGAPVFDHTGAVVAALSVSWPRFRYPLGADQETDPALPGFAEPGSIRIIREAAARISATLGYTTAAGT